MITRKDAIKAGSAICNAAKRVTEEWVGLGQNEFRGKGRGACIYALDNLWYDVLPIKVRDTFVGGINVFYEECGWPS